MLIDDTEWTTESKNRCYIFSLYIIFQIIKGNNNNKEYKFVLLLKITLKYTFWEK